MTIEARSTGAWRGRIGSIAPRDAIALLVLVVAYGGLVVLLFVRAHPGESFDEKIFMDVGAQIRGTGLPIRTYEAARPILFFDHTPLYVYLVAMVTAIGGPSLALVRAVTLAFGVGTLVLVYGIVRSARGFGSAVVGSAFLAFDPFFAEWSWVAHMEVAMCFFLVLAVALLATNRSLATGLAVAAAVMLKEIALAFWLVAAAYQLARRGLRAAVLVALPSVVAFAGWSVYAVSLDGARFEGALRRWLGSGTGDISAGFAPDPRLRVGELAWTRMILGTVLGPLSVAMIAVTALIASLSHPRFGGIPRLTVVPFAYVVVATASSYVIRLKEPRYVIAIVPMLALVIGLSVDWGRVGTSLRRTVTR